MFLYTCQSWKCGIVDNMSILRGWKCKLEFVYKATLNKFKIEIENFESILKEPENFIYEEMQELKRQVDSNRARSKLKIDDLADGFIKKLEEHEQKLKSESNVDVHSYHDIKKANFC